MSDQQPDRATILAALSMAQRAPSIHNSQPWRWQIDGSTLRLFADPERWLPATDPEVRDLVISCGAVLHHARIALAAAGWAGPVHRMPDPLNGEHLATLELAQHEPSPVEMVLAEAIPRRHSSRQDYSTQAVGSALLSEFAALAAGEGVRMENVAEPYARAVLTRAIEDADRAQRAKAGYVAELHRWSGRPPGSPDGVPATNAPAAAAYGGVRLRQFDPGVRQSSPLPEYISGAGALLVLSTRGDDQLAWLIAGEATSAVLLAATARGLVSCPLSQPLEVSATRDVVGQIDGSTLVPQMVLRVGRPALGTPPVPITPRRRLADVLDAVRA